MMTASNLNSTQYMIWTGQQLNPDVPLYNMIRTFTIHGALDPQRFQEAFRIVVERSDALRTVIETRDGVPFQRAREEWPGAIEYLDFSADADPDGRFSKWMALRSQQMFPMDQALFDAALVRLAPQKYVWYLNQHHLITDAWSANLVYQYVSECYLALADERTDALPELPPFMDSLSAQAASSLNGRGDQAAAFWRGKLTPPLPPTDFYGRTAVGAAARSQRVSFPLGPERSDGLKRLAQTPGFNAPTLDMALFTLFAAAYFLYLHKITGENAVGFGSPFANRMTPAQKKTIGPFLLLYLLRVEIDPDETVRSLVGKVRNELFSCLRHAGHYPSDSEYAKAFDVVLNYLTVSYGDFAGLPAEPKLHHSGYHDGNHVLRLHVHDWVDSGELALDFDFNEAVFDEMRRELVVRHFTQILDGLLADPEQPIDRISLLSGTEWERNVVAFNATDDPSLAGAPVFRRFEAQAAATPHAIAVQHGAKSLTYADLNRRANRLAHYLLQQGIGPNRLVGLCVERSADAVIGILAVHKAGGAYVPLDPSYPQERLAYMLSDSAAPLVLTQRSVAGRLPDHDAGIFHLDADWPRLAELPETNPNRDVSDEDPAYVIYTSGSTGRPKGAMVRHRGLTNYIAWAKREYVGDAQLRFPLFTTLAFDLTVTSIFTPLVSGGSIVVYGEQGPNDAPVLFEVLADNQVDVMKLTPAHLALIKDADLTDTRLRTMILGGEDLKRSLAAEFSARVDGAIALYNEYGPTETTVGCMIHKFDPETDTAASVPIGRPIANDRIYLLDENLKPVPTGVVGELCIGGAGVGSGYLNRPELTAEKFVDDPFYPGETLYRTGDIGRWNEQGQIVFLGRRDHQVKLNGARVELGEIEARLKEHSAIREAVVTVTRVAGAAAAAPVVHCRLCGLPSNFPDVTFDDDEVCNLCRDFDRFREDVFRYFKSMDDLRRIVARAKAERTGEYDCMLLFSGGKDSTYVLTQLVEMGLNVLAFSFDNGYISDEAKDNIRRVTDHLGVDLVFGSTPHMNAIFADSLQRFSNVCQGCYKSIYTLSMNLAREKGIRYIFTGLSRGQLFETRLDELFRNRIFDVGEMDAAVLEARKVYHRVDDAVHRLLDVEMFQDDRVFDEIQFVDFFRYTDVELDEMYDFLSTRVPWVRPQDTGRSTNCLINEAGIYVHQRERGYHNYAHPYSWDVRLGHKTREEALQELDDDLRMPMVHQMLDEVGYTARGPSDDPSEARLAAYYVAEPGVDGIEALRDYLAGILPRHMIPTYFVQLDEIPLTPNGKIDRKALPNPTGENLNLRAAYVAPESDLEQQLAALWSQTLGTVRIGIHDNFFELGGASIPAVQVAARIREAFAIDFTVGSFFEFPTIAQQCEIVEELLIGQLEAMSDEEVAALLQEMGD